MVGLYVLFWIDIGYLDYRSVFRDDKILFSPCIFQAKTWTSFSSAYRNALKICNRDNSFEDCLIIKYDFKELKKISVTLMADAFNEWGDF